MTLLFDVASQCCDANGYIALGNQCAQDGICFGELRPIGSYYWFSIPMRFGWTENSLIILNIALVALSVVLSVWAVAKATLMPLSKKWPCCLCFFFVSAAIHGYFFYPVIFHTLSDGPAAAVLLCGIFLLIVQHYGDKKQSNFVNGIQLLIAGLCLGCSALLRAFYLYPVFCFLLVFFFCLLRDRKKNLYQILIFSALIPVVLQYQAMHRVYGSYSFIKPSLGNSWRDTHLNSLISGYDTLVYNNGYQWRPTHCSASYGVLDSLKEKDVSSFLCVLGGRLS